MTGAQRTIAILGGGSAGFTAAQTAAKLGARVLFFMGDNADMASLCVNRGCMPSKAMFEPIDAMHHARRQGLLRVEPFRPEAHLGQIVAWKDREIARFRAYRQKAIAAFESDEFVIVRANARFMDAHTLSAEGRTYPFDAAIIATGSVAERPAIDGLSELGDEIWTNDDILANTALPESLVLIGAGAIGLEFGLRYARLGSVVTIIARSRPLSQYPERFGQRLAQIYEREGVRMLQATSAQRVRRDREGMYVVETEGAHGFEPVTAARAMLAAGRRPAVDTLDLHLAGIELAGGRMTVSEDLRLDGTDNLFAAGDVIGRRMVVHQAHIEAGIAAQNAVTDGTRIWDRRSDIQVVFSDPEFAYAGVTPEAATAMGHQLLYGSKDSRLVGKLHLGGDDHGFGEFIADAETHSLLGAGLLCDDASTLIHLPAYLIDHRHTVHDGAAAEYYHPTRMEIVSSILDGMSGGLGGTPPTRPDERSG